MKIYEPNRQTLVTWCNAVDSHNSGNYFKALEIYAKVEILPGRMRYNMSCAQIKLGNEMQAIENLTKAIEKDKHLAVAYFQRGTLYLQCNRIDESVFDLEMTRDLLRRNTFIDYKPLGLLVKLSSFQVLFNLALAYMRANRMTDARTSFLKALNDADDLQAKILNKSLQVLNEAPVDLIQPMHVSSDRVFAPPKSVVRNLEKPGIVRRAKVVSASNADDKNAAFEGSKRVRELKEKLATKERKPSPIQRLIKNLSIHNLPSSANIKEMKSCKSTSDLREKSADDNLDCTGRRNPIPKFKRLYHKETSGSTKNLADLRTKHNRSCGDLDKLYSDARNRGKMFQLSPFSWLKRLLKNKEQVCTRLTERNEQLPVRQQCDQRSDTNGEQGQKLNRKLNCTSTGDLTDSDKCENCVITDSDTTDKTSQININDIVHDVTSIDDGNCDNMDTQEEMKSEVSVSKKPRPPPPSYPPPPLPPTVVIFV